MAVVIPMEMTISGSSRTSLGQIHRSCKKTIPGTGTACFWGTTMGPGCLSELSLQAQIDPKTADIASMKTQTRAMEDELNDYKRPLS